MKRKKKTPGNHFQDVPNVQLNIGFPNVYGGKGIKHFRNPIRQRIYELFLQGGCYSVVDLSSLLGIPDPRSHIRYLRDSGIGISDYWVKSAFSRYKVYFLK